jgi:phosphoribosylglycinamide formyltransferase 1
MPLNIAVLVSGRGSNLKAILEAIREKQLDACVKVVISNKPDVAALAIAKEHGVEAKVIASQGLQRTEHEKLVYACLSKLGIDYVVMAGYMRVITPFLLEKFRDDRGFNRIINIHPSLLPAFPGANAYEEAFNYGVKISGITIHLVDEEVDRGPILAQESFERFPDDTLESFKQRGLAIEHRLYPKVLQQLAEQKVPVYAQAGEKP